MKLLLLATARVLARVLGAGSVGVQIPKRDDAVKPLTPEQSAAAFPLPEGFRVEIIASEPVIGSPSVLCEDERGRLLVRELHG